jgi:plastocyanin
MRRRVALLPLVAAMAIPAGARAADTTVIMPGKYFDPARATIVAGDRVTWRNADFATHNVRIPSGPFDSGPLGRAASWTQAFAQPGSYPYVCTLHHFMAGNIDVVTATLGGSAGPVLAGEPLALIGRVPVGIAHVAIEHSTPDGGWIPAGPGAAPAADGTFKLTVPALEGAAYRAVTAAGPGQTFRPRVTARVDLHLMVAHGKRRTTLHVHTMPATTGFVVTLQIYSRWHYRWRGRESMALDRRGEAMFRVPRQLRAYARIVLRRRARGAVLVHSDTVKLWNGRRAQDPDEIGIPMPEGGGHHH